MTTKLLSIVVQHEWSKETATLAVIAVMKTYVTVQWVMCGAYDLNLAKNVLTARSAKARRKGPCLWRAADIEAVRAAVAVHLAGFNKKEEVRAAAIQHDATKPPARQL